MSQTLLELGWGLEAGDRRLLWATAPDSSLRPNPSPAGDCKVVGQKELGVVKVQRLVVDFDVFHHDGIVVEISGEIASKRFCTVFTGVSVSYTHLTLPTILLV